MLSEARVDNVLTSVLTALRAVHALVYASAHPLDDARVALRAVQRSVLRGARLAFSGVFRSDQDPRATFEWHYAEALGARPPPTRSCRF